MCSVFGIVQKHGPLRDEHTAEAEFLLAELDHRGPHGARYTKCSEKVLLGSNRLRITDPTNPAADMPMSSADGRVSIVFNGQIYNHRELRRRLPDHPYRTRSDTEVLLAAYREWGEDCVPELDGMFAFAVHDADRGTVFLAGDPTGQKSIYMFEDAESIVFCSEMDPLVRDPHRSATFRHRPVAEYLCLRYVTGTETHVEQITRIEPGTWTELRGAHRRHGRHHLLEFGDQTRSDPAPVARRVRRAVETACATTFDLEVPYGLLLSGGIDSAAVLASGARQGLRFRTYSVGFATSDPTDFARNEFAHSRWLAERYATEHTEIVLDEEAYCARLDAWSDLSGEPLGAQEAPSLVRLFEEASRDVSVMFTGSGPDELFDGYGYGAQLRHETPERLARAYFDTFQWRGAVDTARLIPGVDVAGPFSAKLDRILARYTDRTRDPVQLVQALHFHGRLSTYEFRQMDVISMRYSIEARAPLAGDAVVAAAFDFDPALKNLGGETKGVFKEAMRGLVPDRIVRRPKYPFSVPGEIWSSPAFEERARILFDDDCVLVGEFGVDPEYLRSCWRTAAPSHRNIFSRLYTAERLLRRQKRHLAPSSAPDRIRASR